MIQKIKNYFNLYKRYKHQKNKSKRLTKKVNKLQKGITEDLKLDITNDEIRKLKIKVNNQTRRIKKLELECQKYFDMLIDSVGENNE